MSRGSDAFEVVVVGAGIAGSACAQFLAQAGIRVALVDAHAIDRAGPRWVNGVPRDVFAEVGLPFPKAPELCGDGPDFIVCSPSGRARVRIERNPVIEVDMRLLGDRLRTGASDAGCEVIDRTSVEAVQVEGARPTAAKVTGPLGTRTIRAHLFIDASGLHAVVRRAVLPSWSNVAPTDLCLAAQEVCKVADRAGAEAYLRRHEFLDGETFARTGTAGGYSTLNVRTDLATHEVSLLTGSIPGASRGARIPSGAAMITAIRAENPWIGERIFGGASALPVRGPYTRQVGTGFALLGDAGSQMFAAHGSGIGIGLRTARLLADTLIAAPRSRIGDHDVLHRFAAALFRRHGALLDAYDLVRRLSQDLTPEESESMIRDGLITAGNTWSALAQQLPKTNVTEALAIARAATRAPKLACKLGAAMAKIPLCIANAPTYPDAPDTQALSAFEGRRARILGRSAEPVV